MKTIINDFIYRDRHFTIVKHENHYCAIEDKYIDENGKLKQVLHGGQMYASTILGSCLEHVKQCLDIEYYESIGFTRAEAFAQVFNLPEEMIGQLEAVLAN